MIIVASTLIGSGSSISSAVALLATALRSLLSDILGTQKSCQVGSWSSPKGLWLGSLVGESVGGDRGGGADSSNCVLPPNLGN